MSVRHGVHWIACAAIGLSTLGGCGGTVECSKPRVYQQAQLGKRVEIPEGLDPLPEDKEMTIPKASPQAPPPPGACLDMPPTLRTGSSES